MIEGDVSFRFHGQPVLREELVILTTTTTSGNISLEEWLDAVILFNPVGIKLNFQVALLQILKF